MWVGLALVAVLSLIWLGLGILPKNEKITVVADRGALDQVVAEVRSTNERLSRLESEIAALRRTDDTDRNAKTDLLRRIESVPSALPRQPPVRFFFISISQCTFWLATLGSHSAKSANTRANNAANAAARRIDPAGGSASSRPR